MFNLSVTASPCRLPYRGEALAWQKAQSLRQRLPSVGELSSEARLRGLSLELLYQITFQEQDTHDRF